MWEHPWPQSAPLGQEWLLPGRTGPRRGSFPLAMEGTPTHSNLAARSSKARARRHISLVGCHRVCVSFLAGCTGPACICPPGSNRLRYYLSTSAIACQARINSRAHFKSGPIISDRRCGQNQRDPGTHSRPMCTHDWPSNRRSNVMRAGSGSKPSAAFRLSIGVLTALLPVWM